MDTIVPNSEDRPMSLARGSIGGYEYDRMVLKFSMLDGAREVPCAVSASAMDDLEKVARTAPERREEQFVRLRDRIEQCASRKFLAREFEGTPAGVRGTPACPHPRQHRLYNPSAGAVVGLSTASAVAGAVVGACLDWQAQS